jgi:rhodanese-related sulfurtransferase
MSLIIDNSKYTTAYFSLREKAFVDPTQKISKDVFTPESFEAHIQNELNPPIHLNEYKPVLPDIYPVPARTKWLYEGGTFTKLKKNINLSEGLTFDSCLKNSKRLLKNTKGKIAVEVSGGLDSSIVIGMLEKLGYEPILIGTISELDKFRSERHIQEVITRKFKNVILTNSFEIQFSNLLETPAHFLPNSFSLGHNQSANTIRMLKGHDVKYLFQGVAFDCMLVEAVHDNPNEIRGPILQGDWLNDYVFFPQGLPYIDVAALSPIKQMLLSLRNGQAQDAQKWWARKFFASVIPHELSNYAYKANFNSQWWDGLQSNSEQVSQIVDTAFRVTSLPFFDNFKMQTVLDGMNNDSQRFNMSMLGYANWVNALHKAGRLVD